MSKRSKACEFSESVRQRIKQRDKGCIFCKLYGYSGYEPTQIMHFCGRSHGGLGIEQNGAWGCVVHHQELDNGTRGNEMRAYFKSYLESIYPDWNEESLIFDKFAWIEKSQNDK